MSSTSTMSAQGERSWLGLLLRKNTGKQFIAAVIGGLISWRLSSPRWIHLPAGPGPARFSDRFMLAGLPLLGMGIFTFCILWGVLLFNIWTDSSEAKTSDGSVAKNAAKKRQPPSVVLIIGGVFLIIGTLGLGESYVRFLWPSHAAGLLKASGWAGALNGFACLLLGVRNNTRTVQQAGPEGEAKKEPWIDRRQIMFAVVMLVSLPVLFKIIDFAKAFAPSHEQLVVRICLLAFSIVLTGVFLILQNKESIPFQKAEASRPPLDAERLGGGSGDGKARRKHGSGEVTAWVLGLLIAILLFLPVHGEIKLALLIAPITLLVMHAGWLSSVKRRILRLTQQGDYDEALQVDKQYSWIPGYGTPLQGTVLFGAGRYAEAQALLKPLAFDANGQPLLTSTAYYTYALALVNDGRAAEAQVLLDAAVRVPQRNGGFHVALATCLLSQNKDAERARELLEQAMSEWPVKSDRYEARADQMRRFGRYAWALAACGRREEAQAKLQEALDGATGFRSGDMAGLQYFAGETWRVLGETEKARAAFKEAMRLSPVGAAALSAKKGLAKLGE